MIKPLAAILFVLFLSQSAFAGEVSVEEKFQKKLEKEIKAAEKTIAKQKELLQMAVWQKAKSITINMHNRTIKAWTAKLETKKAMLAEFVQKQVLTNKERAIKYYEKLIKRLEGELSKAKESLEKEKGAADE